MKRVSQQGPNKGKSTGMGGIPGDSTYATSTFSFPRGEDFSFNSTDLA
ncbi:hypothetical protein F441_17927 [Phytophthora nicotianae CJ01A1]|uniref:Uncharacterized protein n=3 Tax=Phytophthora nicotianae TaxID=4792 RepID=W2FYK9_PHYNI|nr:hypothetical protein L915_17570 [Phytophthora nicotianae]ETL29331.1 hypothetical protein L916_17464 [Phytophthora nicotianae]ETM35793.1 hypothetical protein L914_17364 [Phytophthora nicotianae]ETO64364.1 hypothetical protein F444_18074 [Phytophthora nicotianae P1976]ETP05466.1 hypothetical protein F441_17927 [Phytophthora nicotianae CJ01A1]